MALPVILPLISLIATALVEVANFIMQAVRTISSIPWKRIFWWAVIGFFIAYFSAIIFSLVTVAISACRMIFGSSSMASGRPNDIFGFSLDFSAFWASLPFPSFWRFFLWFMGFDWLFWLAVNGFHFWLVGYLLETFSKPIGTMLHKALEAL